LQCIAARCSALQRVAVRCSVSLIGFYRRYSLQRVAVRCSALQCVALVCSALHCVSYGVATISRLFTIIGLLCRISSLL